MVSDPDWYDDFELVAELANVNNQVAWYVLRFLDHDAGRCTPVTAADESRLGGRLVDLGRALQDRAANRAAGRDGDGGAIDITDLRSRSLSSTGKPSKLECVNH